MAHEDVNSHVFGYIMAMRTLFGPIRQLHLAAPGLDTAINTAMTSNAVDEQHTRGWSELQSMIQSARDSHGCCEIDEHRMIILGGCDDDDNALSSVFVYDERTKRSTPLPNEMPAARSEISAVANERY